MKEQEIKQLVRSEISDCFSDLTQDIAAMKAVQLKDVAELKANQLTQAASLKRIEDGLFGDAQMQITGLAEKVKYSYDYVRKNSDTHLVARAEIALTEFKFFKDNKKVLAEIIDKYKITKVLAVILIGSGAFSVINLITLIIQTVMRFVK